MTTAVLSAATFIVVLWTIGGEWRPGHYHPRLSRRRAVVYAVVASGSMVVIGRRFITVSENKNQAEAEYRYVLTRLRENGESIALIQGEREERGGVDRSLNTVLRAWRDICIQNMRTTTVSQTSSYMAPILPIILCAPKFLDDSMSLGQVMQAASAFTIVQGAFNWLVDNYPREVRLVVGISLAGSGSGGVSAEISRLCLARHYLYRRRAALVVVLASFAAARSVLQQQRGPSLQHAKRRQSLPREPRATPQPWCGLRQVSRTRRGTSHAASVDQYHPLVDC